MSWYPGARRLELQPESGSQPAITPTQFIMHSIAAPWTVQRIYEYWRDSTNLESTFGLAYDGELGQFLSTTTHADANYRANSHAVSIETASNLDHTDPWTDAQITALIDLGAWMHTEHGIPLRVCRSWDDPGFGYHRLFPEWSTGGTECPGDARVAQFHDRVFPGVVARATGQTQEDDMPSAYEVAVEVARTPVMREYNPDGSPKATTASLDQYLGGITLSNIRQEASLAGLTAAIQSLAGLLAAQHPGVDTAQIVSEVQQAIADAVAKLRFTVAQG